jgi:hypothetical protein
MKTMPVPLQKASSPCAPHSSNIQLNGHAIFATQLHFKLVLRIRIRLRRINMFLSLPDPHPDHLVRDTDPDFLLVKRQRLEGH